MIQSNQNPDGFYKKRKEETNMKKTLALVLSLVMILVLGAAAAESPFTAENPGTLTVAVYDRSNMNSDYGTAIDNAWTRWIQEKVAEDLHINVEYVAVARSGAESTMTTMLAGQNAPDIIFYYDTNRVSDFVAQGGLADLTEAVELYGENLKTNLASTLPYGQYDGVQYAIPAKRGDIGHLSSFIRKDWLDKIGYELKMVDGVGYISYNDLEMVMKTWKEQGICEYPMAMTTENGTEAETMSPIYMAFLDESGFTDEVRATLPDVMWPGIKDGYAYLNKLYNEGLIQPDWAQFADETQFNNAISTGKAGFWAHAYWQGIKTQNEFMGILAQNDPTAEVVAVCVTNDDGVPAKIDQYPEYGMFIVVPVYSKHVNEAVLYLDWMSIYENFEVINYGFEGEHYVRRADGSHDTTQVAPDASERISVPDLMLVYNQNPDSKCVESELITPSVPEKWQELYKNAFKAARVNTYKPYLFSKQIVSESDYSASLAEKLGELRVKSITCTPEMFEATWDELSAEYLDMGGQTVIDEKVSVFNE